MKRQVVRWLLAAAAMVLLGAWVAPGVDVDLVPAAHAAQLPTVQDMYPGMPPAAVASASWHQVFAAYGR